MFTVVTTLMGHNSQTGVFGSLLPSSREMLPGEWDIYVLPPRRQNRAVHRTTWDAHQNNIGTD
jgi:hypothetical protein